MPDVGGSTCIHCGLRTAHSHRQHPHLARCPCDTMWDGPEEVMEGSILLRGVLGLRSCWTAWYRGPHEGDVDGDVDGDLLASQSVDSAPTPPFLQGYRAHVGHSASNCHFCLRCGRLPRDNRRGFMDHLDGVCLSPDTQPSATVNRVVAALLAHGAAAHLDPHRMQLLQNLSVYCRDTHPPHENHFSDRR